MHLLLLLLLLLRMHWMCCCAGDQDASLCPSGLSPTPTAAAFVCCTACCYARGRVFCQLHASSSAAGAAKLGALHLVG